MRRFRSAALGSLGAMSLALSACGQSTSVNTTWVEPKEQIKPVSKIVVVGVFKKYDTRRNMENAMVKALEARGTGAVASYTLFPKDNKADSAEMVTAVRKTGADGVMLIRLHSKSDSVAYDVQMSAIGPSTMAPQLYQAYSGFYFAEYQGYASNQLAVSTDARLYGVDQGERMIWAGQSNSSNPDSMAQLTEQIAGGIVDALEKDKLIK